MKIKSALAGVAPVSLPFARGLGFGQTVEEFPRRAPMPGLGLRHTAFRDLAPAHTNVP